MKFKDNLLRLVRAVPLIDGLPDLEWEHFKSAVKELFFTTLLSTSPLWIGAFAASLISAGTSQSENIKILSLLWDNLKASINTGALIIYSAALIAPVIYIATQEAKGTLSTKVFPSRMWHILLALIIQLVGCAYFIIQFLGLNMNQYFAFHFSIYLFPFTLALLLIAYCYKNLIFEMDPLKEMENSDKRFSENYSRHRRGE
ncbi:hypothetical protein [Pseudomonas aeruginosa]|uniref:hypothetical protein n=6 Tax=Pseudomonas aeruginosa TaxID=287 RepID=UPI000F5483E0|nr:hypothetical protein [Pseudomonas aeruginosa]ELO2068244.1 hypothetical protein [Pseudomonas aeruginosa]ELS0739879.1 hypothetical protein [Pseudomonas aeruginosa]MBG4193592.1 hypothetical protein [Pseudomonas aeruginosa]MCO2354933.1 hypothetical protein [Pseudomonas aeruginosa]MCO2365295.1 hypothetical protein [Pseudomonas aeruginosa]